jgi:DNA-binding protein HU-beta
MNKRQLVNTVAQQTGTSFDRTQQIIYKALDEIIQEVKRGGEVAIQGFGTFRIQERKARKGRNPATGEEMEIQASRNPVFKASSTFKSAINNDETIG